MTFLNPFVLFGLAAAAIPILIHLFNIRKLRTIEFSTLTFLKELNKNKIRRIKVRQWLLLALRTLLILLIVLAFSRPALQGNFGSAGARAASTLVIIMDNTASMQLHNEQGKFLSQAQQKAMEIVSTLQENDEVYFLRVSDLPLSTTEEPTRDSKRLTGLINDTEISFRYRTIEEGLRLSSRLLEQSKNFNKEVYVLTDGQSSTLRTEAVQGSAGEQLFPPQVKVFYSQLSRRSGGNIAIERTVIPPSLFQTGKPFTLNVVVKNHGTDAVANHLISVTLGKNRVMQKSVSLGVGESAALDFLLIPPRPGFLSGYAESEDDEFEPDNRFYFSLFVPAQASVAIVAPERPYAQYLSAALNTAKDVNNVSSVQLTVVPPSQLSTSAIAQRDVMILSGVKELTAAQAEIVKQYVTNGGNVIFFPAADTAGVFYRYLAALGVPELRLSRSGSSFDKVDLQFPIFRGMFEQGTEKKELSVESPMINTSAAPAASVSIRPVISLSNGSPFLWLRELGRGKVLGVSVPATTDWSDLPMKGIFVPLLLQSVLFLSSPAVTAEEQRFAVGERLEFSSSTGKRSRSVSASAVRFFDTEQRVVPLQSYVRSNTEGSSQTIYTLEQTDQPGIYTAAVQSDTMALLPVNIRREESRGERTDDQQIEAMCRRLGIDAASLVMLPPGSDIRQTITESRFGIELWRYFLIAAVIIALIEMFVAREPKQKNNLVKV